MLNALYVLKNELSEKKETENVKQSQKKVRLLIKRNSKNYMKH